MRGYKTSAHGHELRGVPCQKQIISIKNNSFFLLHCQEVKLSVKLPLMIRYKKKIQGGVVISPLRN